MYHIYLMQSIVCTIILYIERIQLQLENNSILISISLISLQKQKNYDMRKKTERTLRKIYLYISLYTLFTNLGFNCDRF